MAENVFIFGAGASAHAGAPMMSGFLDRTESMLIKGEFDRQNEKLFEIWRKIRRLQQVQSKSYLDLDNVEDIYSALEMALIIKRFPGIASEEIEELRDGLITLIMRTLERSMKFEHKFEPMEQYPEDQEFFLPPFSYEEFCNRIAGKLDFSAITFNYDIGLDYALFRSARNEGKSIDYCLGDPVDGTIKLLKLHGSVNWARCSVCNEVIPYLFPEFLGQNAREVRRDLNDSGDDHTHFEFSRALFKLKHKHTKHRGQNKFLPALVPPTFAKTDYQSTITRVWQQAASELAEARNILVFGYSMPQTDSFFRYLLALGTVSTAKIQRFWVFNPDRSSSTFNRYSTVLGRDVFRRFRYYPKKFEDVAAWGPAIVGGDHMNFQEFYQLSENLEKLHSKETNPLL